MSNVTIDEHWTALCSFIQRICGVPVVKAKRGFVPQYEQTFIAVFLLDFSSVPKDISRYVDMEPNNPEKKRTEHVRGLSEVSFACSGYGAGSLQLIKRLNAVVCTDLFKQFCYENKIGYSGCGEVTDISAVLLDSNYEERAEMKINFYALIGFDFESDHFNQDQITLVEPQKEFSQTIVISAVKE